MNLNSKSFNSSTFNLGAQYFYGIPFQIQGMKNLVFKISDSKYREF